jgi:2-keto-4-pentenoate hydratase/2-oxohepta-3-ene-1,7-dioic acid hydratase in catechol pathway
VRLATIKTASGPVVVGVHSEGSSDRFVDLRAIDADLPATLVGILAEPNGLDRARAAMERGLQAKRFAAGTLLAPIPVPGKILCIGLNYRDHAKEGNVPVPAEPIVFSKFASAVIGTGMPILLPRASQKVDFEAELVAVIGKRGKNIPADKGPAYVAGYMNGNDPRYLRSHGAVPGDRRRSPESERPVD